MTLKYETSVYLFHNKAASLRSLTIDCDFHQILVQNFVNEYYNFGYSSACDVNL
jgi:hypothetical protein